MSKKVTVINIKNNENVTVEKSTERRKNKVKLDSKMNMIEMNKMIEEKRKEL